MALIKCSECGNEISDKATSCIHCGCPVITENVNKNKSIDDSIEYEIISAQIDYETINRWKIRLLAFYWIPAICVILYVALTGTRELIEVTSPIFFCVGIPFTIVIILYYGSLKNTELILTNKRIKGRVLCFAIMGKILDIDFPLNKINAITKQTGFICDSIAILSSSVTYYINYVENAEEFKNRAMKEIDRYN